MYAPETSGWRPQVARIALPDMLPSQKRDTTACVDQPSAPWSRAAAHL